VTAPTRGESGRVAGAAVSVRPMLAADIPAVAALSGQLGYPSTEEQVRRRFERLGTRGDRVTFVAVDGDGRVIGWADVEERCAIESDPAGEICGLVVDEGARNRRVGRRLVEAAERWARGRGLPEMTVRSNVIRVDAHRFYLSIGYGIVKSQVKFRRRLAPDEALPG